MSKKNVSYSWAFKEYIWPRKSIILIGLVLIIGLGVSLLVRSVGQLIEATITRLTKFGAFARLTDDIEGLIHISEISERRIEHPKEVLKEGDVCTLRIIKVDPGVHRIGLSLRKVHSQAYADLDNQAAMDEIGIMMGDEFEDEDYDDDIPEMDDDNEDDDDECTKRTHAIMKKVSTKVTFCTSTLSSML